MSTAVESAAVFLLAENRLLREALARILAKKTDFTVVGSCSFSASSLDQVTQASPDVLVLDSFTSGGAGRGEFLRDVQRQNVGLRLVMVGMDDDEQVFLQSVRDGALGYVLKDASALEVVSTVKAVAGGEAVCPAHLCARLFRYVARQANQIPSLRIKLGLGLTNREQQLVRLIGRGLTNKEIASELRLAEQTVRNHVHRMLRKVGANDRLAVVERCRLEGLPV